MPQKKESHCPTCNLRGWPTDDTWAYWKCRNNHEWADSSWPGDDEHTGD